MDAKVQVVDAMGRTITLAGPARRVVSLVPSESASVVALAGRERLIGRTRFCFPGSWGGLGSAPRASRCGADRCASLAASTAPRTNIADVPVVGGTKDIDVAAVMALAPDLVLANQEENSRKGVQALIDAGLPVHVSFPRSFAEGADYLAQLATLLGVAPTMADDLRASHDRFARDPTPPVPVFVPIWRDPWMTFDARTFASDVLELAGAHNVFADRARRYPLRADLGRAAPIDPGDRDTRYPRVTLAEVKARLPVLTLLPDEPFAFDATHVAELASEGLRAILVSGQDLFWYGSHQVGAVERLRAILGQSGG